MKVFHFELSENVALSQNMIAPGDVVVVSPSKVVETLLEAAIVKQMERKQDAKDEFDALAALIKTVSATSSFSTEVDKAIDKMYLLLSEGMSLVFSGNSMRVYMRAQVARLLASGVASRFSASKLIDGRDLIICSLNEGAIDIDWKSSADRLSALADNKINVVSGGFGKTSAGEAVSLGKSASQMMATTLANLCSADEVVMVVGEGLAEQGVQLTYDEAAQKFAAGGVIYPPVLSPLKKKHIPVKVVLPDGRQLLSVADEAGQEVSAITGAVASADMSLITVYGTQLLGSVGIASKIFGNLASSQINIHFISQSSSEYSISVAVKRADGPKAVEVLRNVFNSPSEYSDMHIDSREVAIVSVFGHKMKNIPGTSGRVFSAIGAAGINIIASSQGGEELSISVVVDAADGSRTLEVVSSI